MEGHGGDFIAEAMRVARVGTCFTLSGGHIFPVFDGLHTRGMRIVDVRHEQTAAFAAEAYGKLSRTPGFAALTAGPGVTNGVSAVTSAFFNGSPMVVAGGRAPLVRWGQGSLQEMDHVPVMASVTKLARTVADPAEIAAAFVHAFGTASAPHRGPVFLDVPMDTLFTRSTLDVDFALAKTSEVRRPADLDEGVKLFEQAERPVLLLGGDVWMNGVEKEARLLAERHRIPTFMNGMGRGVLPADHECALSSARGHAFSRADLVIVAGTPLDFRVGFGKFGGAKVMHLADSPSALSTHASPAFAWSAKPFGLLFEVLAAAKERDRSAWLSECRGVEVAKSESFETDLRSDATPIHPARIYGELRSRLLPGDVVVCDGGDFASYAGKFVDVYEPGGWLDPGPYGCLGTAPGYALAASVLHPERRIVVLMGDGAAGFAMGDWDTLVRFGVNATIVVGNNGIWGLEKHPMKFVYGYDVAADLRPETRYDDVMRALGGHGELVGDPAALGAALDRALATEGPSLVNVVTDPAIAYPRTSLLA